MADHPGYVVLFPEDDEAGWQAASEADHQATYDTDAEFVRQLTALGGAVTGGAGLGPSSTARTIRRTRTAQAQVDVGPYLASASQLSGFFVVTCDDYDALVEAARVLTRSHPVVEIRPAED